MTKANTKKRNLTVLEMASELKKVKRAAIIAHTKPDGDTLGSVYALGRILSKIGAQCQLFCDSKVPDKFYSFFSESSFSQDLPQGFDVMIAVDSSDENRLGKNAEIFLKAKKTFNIDHHISNTRYANFNLVEEKSSTAELIANLCSALEVELDKDIAHHLMLGICTDTGNFAHKNVTPQTLFCAAKLLEAGANLNQINYLMFKKQPYERAKLFSLAISNIRYFENKKIALCTVTKQMLTDVGASPDMTEGFIDFLLSVDSVEVAVCLLQTKDEQFKVSFRSKEKVNVNEIAAIFGGGGHILASGCMISGMLEEVIDKLTFAIKSRL